MTIGHQSRQVCPVGCIHARTTETLILRLLIAAFANPGFVACHGLAPCRGCVLRCHASPDAPTMPKPHLVCRPPRFPSPYQIAAPPCKQPNTSEQHRTPYPPQLPPRRYRAASYTTHHLAIIQPAPLSHPKPRAILHIITRPAPAQHHRVRFPDTPQ